MPLDFAHWLAELICMVKGAGVEEQKARLAWISELRREKALHKAEIAHELELLRIKFAEETAQAKEREARITQDYKEFLDKIDEMKGHIGEAFPDMPKALALVIHHHAKQLIDEMWRYSDASDQDLCRAKLAQFLTVVFDDTTEALLHEEKPKIPQRTLKLIHKE